MPAERQDFTFKLSNDLRRRIETAANTPSARRLRLSLSWFIIECVERTLPALEKEFGAEIAEDGQKPPIKKGRTQ